jgi:hypothetical protein
MIPEPARSILAEASTVDLAAALADIDALPPTEHLEDRALRSWIIDTLCERHPDVRRALDLWLADLAHPASQTEMVLGSLLRLGLIEEVPA